VGSNLDNVQWETILRSVSSDGGFRLTYGQDARPREIAQFLVLDRRMPRSLVFCADKIADNLRHLAQDYGARMPVHDLADHLSHDLLDRPIEAIFDAGLHEFIQDFLRATARIGAQTEIDYRFYA